MFIWCSTHSETPRKHAHPEDVSNAKMTVTFRDRPDARIVNAEWDSNGIHATISIDLEMLRQMLAFGEAATRTNGKTFA